MRDEPHIAASEWALPLRQKADRLVREGRFDEASRLLTHIRRALREEPQGGHHVTSSDLRKPSGPDAVRGPVFVRA